MEHNTEQIGFTKECPTLQAKREEALKVLGSRWILAEKVQRKTENKQ